VIHSGLYYRPGSLKARLAVEGRRALYRLAAEAGIPHQRSGKLVIATDSAEIPALEELERRGGANGLEGLRRVGPEEMKEIEPEVTGLAALHVPEAGVIDFPSVAVRLSEELTTGSAELRTGHAVTALDHEPAGVGISTSQGSFVARVLVNCAGLQADRVAELAGVEPEVRIVPFRGEYYQLTEEAAALVRALVYPVPDPRFPFLGVHFTRRVDGTVEVGPNAVLALGREHYRGAAPDWGDVWETLRYRGFRRFAVGHWQAGLAEIFRSRSRSLYARSASRLIPAITSENLVEGGAGVRAQAIRPDGTLEDDFVIQRAGASVHVLNAPSPGATASLAIGDYIARTVGRLLTDTDVRD
jgi:L-2-hydroxyglutarate oxidase LhgO